MTMSEAQTRDRVLNDAMGLVIRFIGGCAVPTRRRGGVVSRVELEGLLEQDTDGVALVVRFTGHPALATRALLDDDDRLRFVLKHLAQGFNAVVAEVAAVGLPR